MRYTAKKFLSLVAIALLLFSMTAGAFATADATEAPDINIDLDTSEMNFNNLDYGGLEHISIGNVALSTIVSAALTLAVCLVVYFIIMKVLDRIVKRDGRVDGTVKGFIHSIVKIMLWLLIVTIVAGAFGISTASLVALISVAGLALSLSVQNILTNLFSGLTLLLTKPFKTGEFIETAGITGTVKTVGLFYTQMDTLDNVKINIPNGSITGSTIKNYSREPLRRVDRIYSAAYENSTEQVKAAIKEAISMDGKILMDPAPFVHIQEYQDSSIDYVVRVWCKGSDYWDVYYNLNENVRECFNKHGVEMTYNHMNVHIIGSK